MPWARSPREKTGCNGLILRTMRLEAGLSQLQLAALLGCSRNNVKLIEGAKWTRPETLVRVEAAIREGEKLRPHQWFQGYRAYFESANQTEQRDYVSERLLRARANEAERQRRYRARRKQIAEAVLSVVDQEIGLLRFRQGRQFGQEAAETSERVHLLQQVRKKQERILRRGGWLKNWGAWDA